VNGKKFLLNIRKYCLKAFSQFCVDDLLAIKSMFWRRIR
jgi:hypothetical protein